jgi:hypothetical protein
LIMMNVKRKVMLNMLKSNTVNVKDLKIKNLDSIEGSLFDRVLLICGDATKFINSENPNPFLFPSSSSLSLSSSSSYPSSPTVLFPPASVSFFFINFPQPPKSLSTPSSSYFINAELFRGCYRCLVNDGQIVILTVCFYCLVNLYLLIIYRIVIY